MPWACACWIALSQPSNTMTTEKTADKTTWLQVFIIALVIANLTFLAAYLSLSIHIALDNGISKVSDGDATCYVHRDNISCIPKVIKPAPPVASQRRSYPSPQINQG